MEILLGQEHHHHQKYAVLAVVDETKLQSANETFFFGAAMLHMGGKNNNHDASLFILCDHFLCRAPFAWYCQKVIEWHLPNLCKLLFPAKMSCLR